MFIGVWAWLGPVAHRDVSRFAWNGGCHVGLMNGSGKAASFFTTYEFLKQQLPKRFTVFRENPSLNHLAGSTGGEFVRFPFFTLRLPTRLTAPTTQMACLIRVPTEVVKSRAQISAYGKDVGTFGAAVKLMQIEGLRGFYRGFGITLARDVRLLHPRYLSRELIHGNFS